MTYTLPTSSSNPKNKLQKHYSKHLALPLIALLLTLTLLSSFFSASLSPSLLIPPIYTPNTPSIFVSGDEIIQAGTQTALRNAINTATDSGTTIIALTADITLTGSTLTIPIDKDITLTSINRPSGFWRLTGAANQITIIVNGKLTLDGIIVTHANRRNGQGITVNNGGTLVLNSGEISGNTHNNGDGGGINSKGTFTMNGGTVIGNTVGGDGGGIYSEGSFTMNGGVIANNTANNGGGGVCNLVGAFNLQGGTISSNTATIYGGGIYSVFGSFSISDNAIVTNNTATYGGGVSALSYGSFNISNNAIIANNTATYGGGVYANSYVTFTMNGGIITNNIAKGIINEGNGTGGGIHIAFCTFNMNNGTITNNTAISGGGIYQSFSTFNMSNNAIVTNNTAFDGGGIYLLSPGDTFNLKGGVIANNTAIINGGGIGTSSYTNINKISVSDGVIFSNNHASSAYNRDPADNDLYTSQIGSNIIWTSPLLQGYNNYDINYTYGTPIPLYTATILNSYAPLTGTGNYITGTAVNINAGTHDSYTFSGWTANTNDIALPNTPTTTFTMPDHDITITANWIPNTNGNTNSITGGSGGSSNSKTSTNTPTQNKPTPSNPETSDLEHGTIEPNPTPIVDKKTEWKQTFFDIIPTIMALLIATVLAIGSVMLLHRRQRLPKNIDTPETTEDEKF